MSADGKPLDPPVSECAGSGDTPGAPPADAERLRVDFLPRRSRLAPNDYGERPDAPTDLLAHGRAELESGMAMRALAAARRGIASLRERAGSELAEVEGPLLCLTGDAMMALRSPASALPCYGAALDGAGRAGDQTARLALLRKMAVAEGMTGDSEAAAGHLTAALPSVGGPGVSRDRALGWEAGGDLAALQGRFGDAAPYLYRLALESAALSGPDEWRLLTKLGAVRLRAGDSERADGRRDVETLLSQALAAARAGEGVPCLRGQAAALDELGLMSLKGGLPFKALSFFEEAEEFRVQIYREDDPRTLGELARSHRHIAAAHGDAAIWGAKRPEDATSRPDVHARQARGSLATVARLEADLRRLMVGAGLDLSFVDGEIRVADQLTGHLEGQLERRVSRGGSEVAVPTERPPDPFYWEPAP